MSPRSLIQTLAVTLLCAAPASALSFEAQKTSMILGRDTATQLVFKNFAEAPDKVKVYCTVGEVTATRQVGADLQAEWLAPKAAEPQVVLCGALSPMGAALTTFSLSRKETLSLTGLPPLSRVEVDVSGERFGPVRADGEGRADVQVMRLSSSAFAYVTATPPSGAPVKQQIPFAKIQGDPSLIVTSTSSVVADGTTSIGIHAFALGEKGPLDEPTLLLSTPDGGVNLKRLQPGIFSGSWTPGPRAADEEATLHLKGRAARVKLKVAAGLRALASLHVREPVLASDGLAMTVVIARITDATGKPLSQQPLRFLADRGQVGSITDRGDGTYVAPYTAPTGTSGITYIRAELGGARIGEVKIKLVHGTGISVEPLDPYLPADGKAQTILRISARTDAGKPMANGTVVRIKSTLGEVPESTTLEDGRADVLFKAGTTAGAAVLTVTAGKASQTSVVQLVPGDPTRLEVRAFPNPLPCQEQATLHVIVRDRFGNEVPSADVKVATGRGGDLPLHANANAFSSSFTPDCDEGRDEQEIEVDATAGELKSRTMVKVQRRTTKRFGLRAAVIGASDFDSGGLMGAGVELDTRAPLLGSERLRIGLELNGAMGVRHGAPAQLYGVYLGPLFELYGSQSLKLAAGAGLDGHYMTGRLSRAPGDSGPTSQWLGGAHARIVGGFAVGPGDLVAQVRASVPLLMQSEGTSTGVDLSMGYRILF